MTDVIQQTKLGVAYVTSLSDVTPADVPVYNPNAEGRLRMYKDIYRGKQYIGEGSIGRYVPNVDDPVLDYDTGFYRVRSVDPGTLLADLVEWNAPIRGGASAADFLLGVGPRYPQQGYFVYVNNAAEPPVLNVDSGFYTRYPNTKYFRIFAGLQPLPNAEILSAHYGSSGNYLDDLIPAIEIVDTQGLPAWVPDSAFASRQIVDGEYCMVVGYDTNGNVTGEAAFICRNTGMVRPTSATQYRIESVELYGPHVDRTSMQVKYPVNATIDSVPLQCQVNYRGGGSTIKPIDGTKIRLVSDAMYLPTSPDINQPATLIYNLDATEAYDGSLENEQRFIPVQYTIVADPQADAYGFKLCSFPYWAGAAQGWAWRHYLHDLDHDAVYDVTQITGLAANSKPFDPKLYGVLQEITFAVSVSRADPRFNPYEHVQTLWVSLYADGTVQNTTNWTVLFEQGYNAFGRNCQAISTYVSSGVYQLDVTAGAVTFSEWLERLYTDTRPLYNSHNEGGPLTPTHFLVQVAGIRKRFPLSKWQELLQFEVPGTAGDIATIHFVQEVNGEDLYLSSCGLILRIK